MRKRFVDKQGAKWGHCHMGRWAQEGRGEVRDTLGGRRAQSHPTAPWSATVFAALHPYAVGTCAAPGPCCLGSALSEAVTSDAGMADDYCMNVEQSMLLLLRC